MTPIAHAAVMPLGNTLRGPGSNLGHVDLGVARRQRRLGADQAAGRENENGEQKALSGVHFGRRVARAEVLLLNRPVRNLLKAAAELPFLSASASSGRLESGPCDVATPGQPDAGLVHIVRDFYAMPRTMIRGWRMYSSFRGLHYLPCGSTPPLP